MKKRKKSEGYEERPKDNKRLKIMLGIEMGLLVFLAVALIVKYKNPFGKIPANEAVDNLYITLFSDDYSSVDGKDFFSMQMALHFRSLWK